jgi:hypothetical protein
MNLNYAYILNENVEPQEQSDLSVDAVQSQNENPTEVEIQNDEQNQKPLN